VSVTRDWADWALWIFNGLLVVAGFLGIRLAYKTLNTIQRQTKATEMAAIAARDSANVARDTLHLTQAADVHIEEVKLVPNEPLSSDTTIYVVVKNRGQTRAERFTNDLTLGIKERATNITLPRKDIETVIGAGNARSIAFGPLRGGLLSADLDKVLGGQLLLKIWGPLRYRDIFGNGHVIDCECTYNLRVGNFLIDRYEHRREEDAQTN
jgi:hypothetical protein